MKASRGRTLLQGPAIAASAIMQPTPQALRASFQQLVVNHHVQRPVANRSYARKAHRQQGRRLGTPVPPAGPHGAPRDWALNAVRADQTTDAVDTATLQLISDITREVDEQHAATLKRNADEMAGPVEPDSALRAKVKASVLDLQNGLLERETEVGGRRPAVVLFVGGGQLSSLWVVAARRRGRHL